MDWIYLAQNMLCCVGMPVFWVMTPSCGVILDVSKEYTAFSLEESAFEDEADVFFETSDINHLTSQRNNPEELKSQHLRCGNIKCCGALCC